MGTAYTAIPGLGAMPSPLSFEWLDWKERLINYRLGEIPLVRSESYYFSQTFGDDVGGDGSYDDPWQTIAKAQTTHDSLSGDFALYFAVGDIWRETTGLTISKPNVTVCSYVPEIVADELVKPHFNRFTLLYTSGWTLGAGTRYTRVEAGIIEWVRFSSDLETIFYRAADAASCEATTNSFFYDAGGTTLHINTGADPNGVNIEAVTRNSSSWGIRINNGAANCRVHDMWCDGWGMDSTAVGSNVVGIADSLRGTDTALITDCWSFYSGSHAMVHITSGPGNGGGISTYHNCQAGLCMYNGASYETIFNTYSNDGAQETIFNDCVARWGTLPSSDWYNTPAGEVRRGRIAYAHTAGALDTGLVISNNCSAPNSAYGCAVISQWNDTPPAATAADLRAFVCNEVIEATDIVSFTPSGASYAYINCYLKNKRLNETAQAITASRPNAVYFINCVCDLNLASQTSNPFGFYNSTSTDNIIYFYHCHIKVTNCGVTFSIDRDNYTGGNNSPNSQLINTIVDMQGAGTKYVGLNNVAANQRYNAYFGVVNIAGTRGYDQDPAPVILTATIPTLFSSGGRVTALRAKGDPALGVGYDYNGKRRKALPTIGPIEITDGSSLRGNLRPWRGRV